MAGSEKRSSTFGARCGSRRGVSYDILDIQKKAGCRLSRILSKLMLGETYFWDCGMLCYDDCAKFDKAYGCVIHLWRAGTRLKLTAFLGKKKRKTEQELPPKSALFCY